MNRACALFLALAWWAVPPAEARADAELDKAANELALKLGDSLKKPAVKAAGTKLRIQVGTTDDHAYVNLLPGLVKLVQEKLGTNYDARSPVLAIIELNTVPNESTKLALDFRVKAGKQLDDGTVFIQRPSSYDASAGLEGKNLDADGFNRWIKHLMQQNTPRPPTPADQNWKVPNADLQGTLFRGQQAGKFAVEVNVVKAAPGRQPGPRGYADYKGADGLQFVDILPGEEFELVIHNEWKHKVVVGVEIDGIDAFNAVREQDVQPSRGRLVRPKSETGNRPTAIKGWRKTDTEWARFALFNYEKSVAAEVFKGSPAPYLGQIVLRITPAWFTGEEKPSFGGGFNGGTGIGGGEKVDDPTKIVKVNLHEKDVAVILLRYRGPATKD